MLEPIFALALLAAPFVEGVVQRVKEAVAFEPIQTLLFVLLVSTFIIANIQWYLVAAGFVVFTPAVFPQTILAILAGFGGAVAFHKAKE